MRFSTIHIILFFAALCLSASLKAQCLTEEHSAQESDAWLSCESSVHPINGENGFHWIKYDFGQVYALTTSHVWNYNVAGETDRGLKDVEVFHSIDGQNWTKWGDATFAEASGSPSYLGAEGPNFGDLNCQHLAIVGNSNWGDAACFGLAEIKFDLGIVTYTSNSVFDYLPKLSITPNPTNGPLTISRASGDIYDVYVFDAKGQIVLQHQSTGLSPEIQLDLKELSDGVYVLQILTPEGMMADKVVVQR